LLPAKVETSCLSLETESTCDKPLNASHESLHHVELAGSLSLNFQSSYFFLFALIFHCTKDEAAGVIFWLTPPYCKSKPWAFLVLFFHWRKCSTHDLPTVYGTADFSYHSAPLWSRQSKHAFKIVGCFPVMF